MGADKGNDREDTATGANPHGCRERSGTDRGSW